MPDFVVDANVWATASKTIEESSSEELKCLKSCLDWLRIFTQGPDSLVVDAHYRILNEYRENIRKGSLPEQWLNAFESKQRLRAVLVEFEVGDRETAILPDGVIIPDRNDRKFVAASLACSPHVPIVNATDSDWQQVLEVLTRLGIDLIELCPDRPQR